MKKELTRWRESAAVLAAVLMVSAAGCRERPVHELQRELLFVMEIGKMENHLDLIQLPNAVFDQKNRLYMRDGLFYVGNGNSSKVMEFTSYGDLVMLLYNPEANPEPVSLKNSTGQDGVSTKRAVPHPLWEVGEIAVDSKRRIYVEAVVSEAPSTAGEAAGGAMFDKVIYRFGSGGNHEATIGREGLGGSPFGHIQSVFVTDNDDLIVVWRTAAAWCVNWYHETGRLMYERQLGARDLPEAEKQGVTRALDRIVPDMTRPFLYLQIRSFQVQTESSTGTTSTIVSLPSRIFRLNLVTDAFDQSFEIPQAAASTTGRGARGVEIPTPSYEFLGVTSQSYFFFLGNRGGDSLRLLVLDGHGRVSERRDVVIEDEALTYMTFHLSSTGIVSALLADEFRASLVWWRSDKLLARETTRTPG